MAVNKKCIGIIGAGSAGLAALKTVLDTPQYKTGLWIPTIFEARSNVGGVWLPSPSIPHTGSLPPTPLYDSLTTNLPHPVMAFSSLSFPHSTPLYPKADIVHKYLESYADTFSLRKHIFFKKTVTNADWDSVRNHWVVHTHDTGADPKSNSTQQEEHHFELLLVCNGHYSLPRYPTNIPGVDTWLAEGRASHSIFYRNPSSIPSSASSPSGLKNSTILIIGGGPSGSDIAAELAPLAKRLLHSFAPTSSAARSSSASSNDSALEKTPTAIPKPHVTRFSTFSSTVYFNDGSEETDIDYCILATGYEVSFPFFASGAHSSGSSSANLSSFEAPKPALDLNSSPNSFKPATSSTPTFTLQNALIPPLPVNPHPHIPQGHLYNTSWSVFPLARHLFGVPECGFGLSPDANKTQQIVPGLPPPTSLAFLSLLVRVAPFPLVEVQARAALAAFDSASSGSSEVDFLLPSKNPLYTPDSGYASPNNNSVDQDGNCRSDARNGASSGINWAHEHQHILQRWEELRAKWENSKPLDFDEDFNSAASKGDLDEERDTQMCTFISKEWHRFPVDAMQFAYRDALDDFAFELSAFAPHSRSRTRVKPWERRFYAEKLTLRAAWRELEARGLAEEWVRGVGSGGGNDTGDEEGRKEKVEREWVKLMERVSDFGKTLP